MLKYFEAFLDYVRQQGIYIYRGDPAGYDFLTHNFTKDGAWHELDLSGIVPANAKAVDASVLLIANAANTITYFKRHSQVNNFNSTIIITHGADVASAGDFTIPLDSDRKVDYKFDAVVWTGITFTVKGWWY